MRHSQYLMVATVVSATALVAGFAVAARPDTVSPKPLLSSCSGDLDGDGRAERAVLFLGPGSRQYNLTVIDTSTVSILYYDIPALDSGRKSVLACDGGFLRWGYADGDAFSAWRWSGGHYVYESMW